MNPKKRRKRPTTPVSGSVFRQRKSPYSEAHKKKPKPPQSHRSVIATHTTQLSHPKKMCFDTAIPYNANGITTK